MKHCSSSPEYINSQGEFTKTIWLEHNKEFARAREYAWAVGALHSLGPDYESYVQRLEGNIRRRLLGTLGRTEANEAMNTWIRKNSEKVIKTTWDLAKHTKDGLYRLDSALELLAESPSIKLTRMRNPQRLGRMGTKVETYHGRVDCWNMRNPGTNENVYSEWLGDRDISGQGNEESSED
ncbi:hypothetical protein I302_108736 [Kwoniella bestiolae CBS 10118]|uniref:Uncharacterized protein n=1 Tax=Kwoniella bestiolae CBS 10118 TaxID=1296100 RepID=A0A1B9FTZ5_9TREE|nr:hypothetical protein I302_07873 [Kwoniella bestiolae CBS 10118]OCF22228.1 hypothetical protein I302_07873 [Kwoniella bestiolae CBS 10118]